MKLVALKPEEGVAKYADNYQELMVGLQTTQAEFFYFGVLNMLPKIHRGLMTVVDCGDRLALRSKDNALRLLPTATDTKKSYVIAMINHAGSTGLKLLPEYAAEFLATAGYKRTAMLPEHVCSSEFLANIARGDAGRSIRSMRRNITRAGREFTIESLDAEAITHNLDRLKEVNAGWYKQNRAKKFRTYDKRDIDWMLTNWSVFPATAKPALLVARAADGTIVAMNAASMLSNRMWSVYMEKYDRDTKPSSVNHLLWHHLGRHFHALGVALENDGQADTPGIKRVKDTFTLTTQTPFEVKPK